jgi:hypothetical protein
LFADCKIFLLTRSFYGGDFPFGENKMKLLTIIILAITAFTAFTLNKSKVSAMESASFAKCAIQPFNVEYENSKSIFAGKVLSVRKEGDEKIFTFRVEKYWKSKVKKNVEVRYYENMRYQAWLEVGKRYLVYAKGENNGVLSDGRCSWTKSYSDAKGDLKLLKKGKIPR